MFFDSSATPPSMDSPPPQSPSGLPLSKSYKTKTTAAVIARANTATAAALSASPAPSTAPTDTNPSSVSEMAEAKEDDAPTRDFFTKQALANAAVLHPLSAPTIVTSLDPTTSESRTTILATNPAKVLFQQVGTSSAAYEALLAQTELAMHQRLQMLDEDVEGLRSAVDTARLQKENAEMLEALERSRGAFQLHLPTRQPHIVAEPAPPKSLTPAQLYVQESKSLQEGLPKSRASRMKPAVAQPSAPAVRLTELPLPEPDLSEMVSPRTIPRAFPEKERHPGVVGLRLQAGSTSRWGTGPEADDVAAWIKEVSEAEVDVDSASLTPPLTPPPKLAALPKSRAFEGR